MQYHQLNILGDIHIKADRSLAETARVLGEALGGLSFEEDPAGTFDEFPSYSAKGAGLSFAVLGIPHPDEQVGDKPIIDYSLQIDLAFKTFKPSEPCDASGYFAEMITKNSNLTVTLGLEVGE